MKFARLFDIGDEQLLVYTELDPEKDVTIIHNITDTKDARIDTKLEVKSIDHEDRARRFLENMNIVNAAKLIDDMQGMLNN